MTRASLRSSMRSSLRYQRGLSLVGCAFISALLAYAAMTAIFAMRYQRNLLAESWNLLTRSAAGTAIESSGRAAVSAMQPVPSPLRKCRIKGQVVYSNVDCADDNRTSRQVVVAVTQGIEAPKVAPVAATPMPDATERAIEHAVSGH